MAAHPLDFPLLQDFNVANQAPPPGFLSTGFWGDSPGAAVVSNQLQFTGSGWSSGIYGTSYDSATGPVGLRLMVPTPASGSLYLGFLTTSGNTSPTGYLINQSGSTLNLLRYASGSPTTIGTFSISYTLIEGFAVIRDDDGQVHVWTYGSGAWTKRIDVTDTTYTGTLWIAGDENGGAWRFDDLGGGHPTPAASTPTRTLLGVGA